MGLELLDGTFSGVAVMEIQWDELGLDVPFLLDSAPVVSIGFVVEDFKSTLWPRALRRFMMEYYASMRWVSFLVCNSSWIIAVELQW